MKVNLSRFGIKPRISRQLPYYSDSEVPKCQIWQLTLLHSQHNTCETAQRLTACIIQVERVAKELYFIKRDSF